MSATARKQPDRDLDLLEGPLDERIRTLGLESQKDL